MPPSSDPFASIEAVQDALAAQQYVAERGLATTLFLAHRMQRPLFLEGEPGVGKTEVAKVLSAMLGAPLIRLQCYEGLDVHNAVYEWNYTRQILHIRLVEAADVVHEEALMRELFGPEYLIKRPLLQAVDAAHDQAPVLLIDELDRADEEFEAFLLEVLSDFQVTIPELGTIRAEHPPYVVITSNRTREVHDALKRRCLYYWIDYPDLEKELSIVQRKVPAIRDTLAREVVAFVQALREADLYKLPGVAETLDWSRALMTLSTETLSPDRIDDTLGTLLKYHDDVAQVRGAESARLLAQIRAEG